MAWCVCTHAYTTRSFTGDKSSPLCFDPSILHEDTALAAAADCFPRLSTKPYGGSYDRCVHAWCLVASSWVLVAVKCIYCLYLFINGVEFNECSASSRWNKSFLQFKIGQLGFIVSFSGSFSSLSWGVFSFNLTGRNPTCMSWMILLHPERAADLKPSGEGFQDSRVVSSCGLSS